MIAGVVFLGFFLGIVTDVIRLGPSEVALPADALSVVPEFIRIPDGDPAWDYYYLVATISNRVLDPSVQPYEAVVTFRTNSGETLGHYPSVDDHRATTFAFTFPDVDRTFTFPAGSIGYSEPSPGTATWTARGESGWESRPIFRDQASFVLEIRIVDGMKPGLSTVVTVTWYYHSAIQAYPVASRTVET
jgi:hypothetical protein